MKQNIIKRLLSMLLIVSVLSGMWITGASAAQEDKLSDLGIQYWELMTSVGVFDETDGYTAGEEITRGAFVRLLMKLGNYKPADLNGKNSSFQDVSADDENARYVETAYQLGYIRGYGNGNFGPEQSITKNEAIKLFLDLLGYDKYAAINGGYPQGYIKIAEELDLTKNVGAGNEALTWECAIILATNAAHTEITRITSEGSNIFQGTVDGVTLFVDRFSIYDTKAVIEANEYTALLDADGGCPEGYVVADGEYYATGTTNASEYLGMNMHMYYRYDEHTDESTLLYIAPNVSKNNILELDAEDISGLDEGRTTLKYFDGTRTKNAKLAESAYLIWNGKMAELKPEMITFEIGNVTLIDNDNDNKYDVISVMSYKTYVVSAVTEDNYRINTKQGTLLEFGEENGPCVSIIKKNDKVINFGEIKSDDIISYAESSTGKEAVKTVLVSDRKVTGTVENLKTNNSTVEIGGIEYNVIASAFEGLKIGYQGTFYIDVFGNIVYITGKYDKVYGYLNNIAVYEDGKVYCKIFTENNRWVELKVRDKITFNGNKKKDKDVMTALGSNEDEYRQLVRYTVNSSGELNSLETAKEITMGTLTDEIAIKDDTFRLSASGKEHFRTTIGTFNGVVGVKSDAIIFAVPDQSNGRNEEGFNILTYNDLQQDTSYSYEAYNANEVRNSSVILIKDYVKAMNTGSTIDTLMLVTGIGKIVNSDDEVCLSIEGYWGSDEEVALPTNIGQNSSVKDLTTLNTGDIIQFTCDSRGEIDNVELKYQEGTEYSLSPTDSPYKAASFVAGVVLKYSDEEQRIVLEYNASGATVQYSSSGAKVYIYDTKAQTLSVGKTADIMSGDRIFMSARYLMGREIYIIRD